MAQKKIADTLDFLWLDKAFSDDKCSVEKFREACEQSERLTVKQMNSSFSYLRTNYKQSTSRRVLYNKQQAWILEVMLGLTTGPNRGLMFEDDKWIRPSYKAAPNKIILKLANDNKYTEFLYYFINLHLSDKQRYQDYLDFLKKRVSNSNLVKKHIESDDICKQMSPTVSVINQKPRLDGSYIGFYQDSISLVAPKPKEYLLEKDRILLEASMINGQRCIFSYKPSSVHFYEQPSSQLVQKYIRFRKYWFIYKEKDLLEYSKYCTSQYQLSDDFPVEDSLLQYIEWVRQVLSYYEQPNTYSAPVALDCSLITTLHEYYPDIPDAINFFNNLIDQNSDEILAGKRYGHEKEQEFLEILISGIEKLRERPYDYYINQSNQFLNEDDITANLKNIIDAPDSVHMDLQAKDGKSKIDLLLRCNQSRESLAIEAKIAFKNKRISSKNDIEKALFIQAPSYSERFNCDACIVFYILDGDLMTVRNNVCDIVKSKPGWLITPKMPEKACTHYILMKENKEGNEKLQIDILFVCLHSQSNTQRSRSDRL